MELPADVEVFEGAGMLYWIRDGIIFLNAGNEFSSDIRVAQAEIETLRSRMNYKKLPAVLDISGRVKNSSREIRENTQKELPELFSAIAFVSSTALGRMMINIFQGIKPLPYPTKVFRSAAEATRWAARFAEISE